MGRRRTEVDSLWDTVVNALAEGTADDLFVLDPEATAEQPLSPSADAQCWSSSPNTPPPLPVLPATDSKASPTSHVLSVNHAKVLASKACQHGNSSVLKFLFRKGLATRYIDVSAVYDKDDFACARVLHEQFNIFFSPEMLKKAFLKGCTELASYMLASRDPPAISTEEEARELIIYAATVHRNASLMSVIALACSESVSFQSVLKLVVEPILTAILEGDHDPEEDIEQRSSVLNFLLGRGAELPEFYTKAFVGDPRTPRNRRRVLLVSHYLQGLIQSSSDYTLAAWSKQNLHSCIPDILYLDGQPLPLVMLDLSKNCLTSLPSDLFDGSLPTLSQLKVDHNELSSLYFGADVDFSKSRLRAVDFSFNKLTHVPQFLAFLPALIDINLSNNEIRADAEKPPDSHRLAPETSFSAQLRHSLTASATYREWSPAFWTSIRLETLNLSKNKLAFIPLFVANLPFLTDLDISYNQVKDLNIVSKCCIRLTRLNASFNPLGDDNCPVVFPGAKTTLNWKHLLKKVELVDTKLTFFPRELCTLKMVEELDLSHNLIESLSDDLDWDCPRLMLLKLGSNMLGQEGFAVRIPGVIIGQSMSDSPFSIRRLNRRRSRSGENNSETTWSSQVNPGDVDETLVLPADKLPSLLQLDLSDNNFTTFPGCVCKLTALTILDMSNNAELGPLPPAVGQLKSLFLLRLNGCTDARLLRQISPFKKEGPEPRRASSFDLGTSVKTRDLIAHLRQEYRREGHYYSLKLAVVGGQGVGKTQLLDALRHANGRGNSHRHDDPYSCEQSGLTLNANGAVVQDANTKFDEVDQGNQVLFTTFDVSNIEVLTAFRHLFFSTRVLFLVVWNIQQKASGIEAVRSWVRTIRVIDHNARVMVVATHCEKGRVTDSEMNKVKTQFVSFTRHPIHEVHFVSPSTGHNIPTLRRCLFEVAKGHCESFPMRPRSYIQLARFCMASRTQFRLWGDSQGDSCGIVGAEFFKMKTRELDFAARDLDSDEELQRASAFLHKISAVIHFEDTFSQLSGFYFMDPDWVRKAVLRLLNEQHLFIDGGILSMQAGKVLYLSEICSSEKFHAFMALLEKGRVLFQIGFGEKKRFMVPSALPKQRPAIQSLSLGCIPDDVEVPRVQRIYSFNRLPAELWGLLVSQLLVKLENWCQPRYLHKSFNGQCMSAVSWATGIVGFLPDSIFKVEGLAGVQVCGHTILFPGINVMVRSAEKNFAVMALIVQHINGLLSQWFHGDCLSGAFAGPNGEDIMCVVPCPACCHTYFPLASVDSAHAIMQNVQSPGPDVESTPPHFFPLPELAGLLACKKTATCQYKRKEISLEDVIPDLMFCDLPKDKVLDRVENLPETPFASGGFGAVYQYRIFGQDVAVKVYTSSVEVKHQKEFLDQSDRNSFSLSNASPSDVSSNGRVSELSSVGEPMLRGLAEAQYEASRLARLNHPCIVSFVGASIYPPSVLMEFAPLGSLGSFIRKKMQEEKEALLANVASNQVLVEFPDGVLGRSLTVQVAYQVALGLQHIHQQSIIYRDLKAENILLFSLDTEHVPCVKLTDYGIAGEDLPGGVKGMVGTVGYQAPEIILGATQTNKIDIYAYAMFLVELLDGRRPFEEQGGFGFAINGQVLRGARPTLVSRPSLVQIEDLMKSCWAHSPDRRPAASSIVQKLRRAQMACQHQYLMSVQQAPDMMHFFSTFFVRQSVSDSTKAVLERRISARKLSRNRSESLQREPEFVARPSALASQRPSLSQLPLCQELLFASFPVDNSRMLVFVDVGSDMVANATEIRPVSMSRSTLHCTTAVDNMLWLATGGIHGDENHISVYSLESTRLHKLIMFSTERPVVSFHCHSLSDGQHEDGATKQSTAHLCVLAGLSNGTVALFFQCQKNASPSQPSFTIGSEAWIRADISLRCVALTPKMIFCFESAGGDEVWCGVGSQIAVLRLQSDTQMCEEMDTVDFDGSELDLAQRVSSLCHIGQYMWAIVDQRVALLKFDVAKRQLLGCYDLNLAPTHQQHLGILTFNPGIPLSVIESSGLRHRSTAVRKEDSPHLVVRSTRPSSKPRSPYSPKNVPILDISTADASASETKEVVRLKVPPSALTCLLAVKDTLWVGQQNGDILVLDCPALIDPSNKAVCLEDDDNKDAGASVASKVKDNLRVLSRLQLPKRDKRCSCPVQKLVKVPSGRVVVARDLASLPVAIGSMDTWEAWDKQRWEDFHRQIDKLKNLSQRE